MYQSLKKILKSIIPKRLLFRIEPALRSINYQFHKGNNYQCNICDKNLNDFIELPNTDLICPNCGSLPRTRRLWNILSSGYLDNTIKVLHFSPSRSLYRKLKNIGLLNYNTTDLSGDFISDFHYDITNLETNDETYGLIICYHILEHIESDMQAIRELYRVLKKGGTCFVQTPFKVGEIYEDKAITSDAERLKHFGQSDHVRIYSVKGLKQRLEKGGFKVQSKDFNETENNSMGFALHETILVCTK